MSSKETEALAMRIIPLLQEVIKRDFGLDIKLGAELEFCAYPLNRKIDPKDDSWRHPLSPYMELGSDGLFEHSRHISRVYKECGMNAYEVVFDHQRNHGSGATLARIIQGTKKQMENNAERYGVAISFAPEAPLSELEANIDRRRKITCSLQISFSLFDEKGVNILRNDWPKSNPMTLGFLEAQAETVLLHAPYPSSYDRFLPISQTDHGSSIFHAPARISLIDRASSSPSLLLRYGKTDSDGYNTRIENRLAGSDAPPASVILATLAGANHALRNQTSASDLCDDLGAVPGHTEAVERFQNNTLLRPMLNRLAPSEKLGDRFCASVLEDVKREPAPASFLFSR